MTNTLINLKKRRENMVEIKLDEENIKDTFQRELATRLDELQSQSASLYLTDLQQHSRMSVNPMQDHFLYNADFPNFRVGQGRYFPAEGTKNYLVGRLKNQ